MKAKLTQDNLDRLVTSEFHASLADWFRFVASF
jgi:hypothetical protein